MEGEPSRVFSALDILDLLNKDNDGNDEVENVESSEDSDDGERRECDFVDEDCTHVLLPNSLLLPSSMAMFIDSLGDTTPAGRDSLLLLDPDLNEEENGKSI